MSSSSIFDLKGIDTSKIGGNKYVDYKLSDFQEDQNLSKKGVDTLLDGLGLNKEDLKRVPRTTTRAKIDDFLFKGARDYYLPTSITERLAEADKVKTEKENYDPFGNLDKLKSYNLDLIKAQDEISRKGRLADVGMEYAMQRAQLPYYADFYKDLSKTKQEELLRARQIQEGFAGPTQERIGQSALTAAVMGNTIATQQDAATRFAQAGMRTPTATFSV
tara:strand:+ start:85 stop:741 length:657 start_codon:yes stop_codon:yes gene_type:complete